LFLCFDFNCAIAIVSSLLCSYIVMLSSLLHHCYCAWVSSIVSIHNVWNNDKLGVWSHSCGR
jgi:hypothetical protein